MWVLSFVLWVGLLLVIEHTNKNKATRLLADALQGDEVRHAHALLPQVPDALCRGRLFRR